MTTEHTNRARKSIAIANALRSAGADTDAARNLDDAGWQLAAKVAARQVAEATGRDPEWTDASDRTRTLVATILEAIDETGQDDTLAAMAGVAAGHVGAQAVEPAAVVTGRAVQSSGVGPMPGDGHITSTGETLGSLRRRSAAAVTARTGDERSLCAAVDAAIARQHSSPTEPDPNEDAYHGWCVTNDMDPDDPAVRAAYADHLDEGYRWAGAGGGR